MSLPARVAAGFAGLPDGPVALAVSGGSDSIALMHLAFAADPARPWRVVTVDHGLRPEAAAEAAGVAAAAQSLGLPHVTLDWGGWDGRGNLQDRARQARRQLIGDWARAAGIGAVALGHTLDDQAETVLMRLARGSGVDGLAGMAPRRREAGMLWLRPLLQERREDLRNWLRGQGISWIDDPSNDDPRFDRVRARRLLAAAGDLGIEAAGLAETAQRMAAARAVLGEAARSAAERLAMTGWGAVTLAPDYAALPDETRWRLLAGALCQVSGHPYRPRLLALKAAERALAEGRTQTLHACLMVPCAKGLRIQPEPKALSGLEKPVPGRWAGWRIDGPATEGVTIRAMGEAGLALRPGWRAPGLSFLLAQTTPGLWRGGDLIAAPALEPADWRAVPAWDKAAFAMSFISH